MFLPIATDVCRKFTIFALTNQFADNHTAKLKVAETIKYNIKCS